MKKRLSNIAGLTSLTLALMMVPASGSAQAAMETVWKCTNPDSPLRFITSEDRQDDPPPCERWVEVRAPGLADLMSELGDERFEAANFFLASASNYTGADYPEHAPKAPSPTLMVYSDPAAFGFDVVSVDSAAPGSLVVFNGLGGILVEVREPDTDAWTKQVLYPSAARGFELFVADLQIPGKLEAKVLREKGGGVHP